MAEHGWCYKDDGIIVYRASSFGSCTRSLVCARNGETAVGPRAGLRAAMDASAGLEDEILRRYCIEMATSGIVWQQKTVELTIPGVEDDEGKQNSCIAIIRGHLDGMDQEKDAILEVKALGDGNWDKYMSGGLDAMGSLGDKYRMQMALYGHATERKVRLVVGHKVKMGITAEQAAASLQGTPIHPRDAEAIERGWFIDEVDVGQPLDPESLVPLADIHARIALIEDHAARDELPPCDGGCRPGDPFAESHVFESFKSADDDARAKMARFQEIKDILGSADKGTGLLGEKEDLSEWMKENLGVGKHTAGMYNAVVSHVKPTERIDTKRLKRERPEIAEEYTTFGQPTIKLVVTGGEAGQ